MEKNCSEDSSDAESEMCLGHTGEMKRQCTFTVKGSVMEECEAVMSIATTVASAVARIAVLFCELHHCHA